MTERNNLPQTLEEHLKIKLGVLSHESPSIEDLEEMTSNNIPLGIVMDRVKKIMTPLYQAGIRTEIPRTILEPIQLEHFTLSPVPRERSPGYDRLVSWIREFYEAGGMTYDEKASTPSESNCDPPLWFRNSQGKSIYVTYTPDFINDRTMEMLFTTSFVDYTF
ncbi:MAG: hypothetical protein NTX24_04330 [Candidatus Pacearchaeota archaeon]|nr:hypothetical protein [Candidatus Pacearchaeota archaeon]